MTESPFDCDYPWLELFRAFVKLGLPPHESRAWAYDIKDKVYRRLQELRKEALWGE